ncbi:MAG TPA: outer membrane beta-barrel protein [Gammaproteobacteria bacterium]|jgi:hypothetical protein
MKNLIALCLLATVSAGAGATDLDYSYLDLSYIRASNDFSGSTGNGYQLDGSWSLGSSGFYLEGGYQHERFGSGLPLPLTLTPENYRLGGGYHLALSKSVDFMAHADYVSAKTTAELDGLLALGPIITSQSDHGYRIGAGIRAQLAESFELDAGLDHDNVGFRETGRGPGCGFLFVCVVRWRQDGPENVLSGALRFRIQGPLVLGLEYRHSSLNNGNDWTLSARWDF